MDLYLVRHAQSENNALIDTLRLQNAIHLWPVQRQADPPLTARGHQQAKALACMLLLDLIWFKLFF